MHPAADIKNSRTAGKHVIQSTALEIHHERGIIYVYGQDGSPLLTITGLPRPIPDPGIDPPSGRQLTIEISAQGTHCEWVPYTGAGRAPQATLPDENLNRDPEWILKQAGATIVGSRSKPE